MTLHSDIPRAIQNDATDSELNNVISSYLSDHSISKTVSQWRIENYAQLRKWAYPNIMEFIDAQVLINSSKSDFIEKGKQQLQSYIQACLDVKDRFPKA